MDAVQQDYILMLLGSQDPHPAANGLPKPSTGAAGMCWPIALRPVAWVD